MITDLRLHGIANSSIDFYVTVAGPTHSHTSFFDQRETENGPVFRCFASGNEFVISTGGIQYQGNGGFVSEYLFGAEQPTKDLARPDVRNRLILYGTRIDAKTSSLEFTPQTDGEKSFDEIFAEGNPLANYFFFLHTTSQKKTQDLQKKILKHLGKPLKHSRYLNEGKDAQLALEILRHFPEDEALLFLFKLVHRDHVRFQSKVHEVIKKNRRLTREQILELDEFADHLSVEPYQRERIRLDVIYNLGENKKIVDQYREFLATHRNGPLDQRVRARLNRLRTLGIRNHIPAALFDKLDNLLLDEWIESDAEVVYLKTTREILEGLFFQESLDVDPIAGEDMVSLLVAKKEADEKRDRTFEELLLETSRICDERAARSKDLTPLERLGEIITYFDRYDTTASTITQLAFMENQSVSEDQVRNLLNNQRAFNEVKDGLFHTLFVNDILDNSYLPRYGHQKMGQLMEGLDEINEGQATLGDVAEKISRTAWEEQLYSKVHVFVRNRLEQLPDELRTKHDTERLREGISTLLKRRGELEEEIPAELFSSVVMDVKKELLYVDSILPRIAKKGEQKLRNDFIENSGLDRFRIEELEENFLRKWHPSSAPDPGA